VSKREKERERERERKKERVSKKDKKQTIPRLRVKKKKLLLVERKNVFFSFVVSSFFL